MAATQTNRAQLSVGAEGVRGHGELSPLVDCVVLVAAGAELPVHPANMLQQGAEHGPRAQPVGCRAEEGLRNCKSAADLLLCFLFFLTFIYCVYML